MAKLTTETTQASGLGTKLARWVFIFCWVLGVFIGYLDRALDPLLPINAVAHGAGLLGGLILTSPGSKPLRRSRSVWLPVFALFIVIVTLTQIQTISETWSLVFSAYIVAFAIPRGNALAGSIGSVLVIGYIFFWGLVTGLTGHEFALLMGVPIGCLIAGIVWRLVLGWIVRKERYHRTAAAQAAVRAAESLAAIRRSQVELTAIRDKSAPLLQRIIAGLPTDSETRVALTRVEAEIRDQIRAPHLQHPDLLSTFGELRNRGVTIVVLGEPTLGEEPLHPKLVSQIIDGISEVKQGRVVVRSFPENRKGSISIVIQTPQKSEQVLLDANGLVLSRG